MGGPSSDAAKSAGPSLGDEGGDEADVTDEPGDVERGLGPTPPARGGRASGPGGAAARWPPSPASENAGSADGRPPSPPDRQNRDAVGALANGAAGWRHPGDAPERAPGDRTL